MGSFDKIWEQIHREQDWGRYPSEEVVRFVARNYYRKDRAAIKMLDAGCGTGAISWYMAREGFDVYAFDGSQTAIRKAEQRIQDEGLWANFMVGDALNMDYASDYFDGVIDSAMIYANTVVNIKAILKECHRVLRKKGKLFSTGLFRVGMTGYGTGEKLEENTFRELTEGSLAHRGTVHFFDEQQICTLWTEGGFRNIKVDSLARTDRGGIQKICYYMVEAEK